MRRLAAALLLLLPLAGCGGSSSSKSTAPLTAATGGADISVTAKAFSFSPSTITVKAGQSTSVALKATDIAHDITVDDPHIHIHASGGKTGHGEIKIDQAGTYTFYCSVPGHRAAGMVGKLVVVP